MAMWGADAGELLAVAARLEGRAEEIDRAQRSLTGRLRSAPWDGPGADRYRQHWETTDRQHVLAAAQFLRDSAQQLRTNAAQQQQASNSGTGGIGAAGLADPAVSGRGAASARNQSGALWAGFSEIFPLALEYLDEAQLVGGFVGKALGPILGAFNLGMGAIDFLYDRPYEGNFQIAETTADY